MVGDDWKDGGTWSLLSCGAYGSGDLSTSTRSKNVKATSKTAMTEMRFISKPTCWQPTVIGMQKALAGRRLPRTAVSRQLQQSSDDPVLGLRSRRTAGIVFEFRSHAQTRK